MKRERFTPRVVSWFSCGAASAVATSIVLHEEPAAHIVYCATGSEHADNERFLTDCERWYGRDVTRIASVVYKDTWDVWEKRRYIAGINGAPCTTYLKIVPSIEWRRPDDLHAFGYTADKRDVTRFDMLRDNYPELKVRAPLIEAGLTKANCLSLVKGAGIALPVLYGLGFHNNNCMPCVKAQSPAYWALVRKEFPAEFERMAELSRRLGVRLARMNGERRFIDEIPLDQSTTSPIVPSCDFLCSMMTNE